MGTTDFVLIDYAADPIHFPGVAGEHIVGVDVVHGQVVHGLGGAGAVLSHVDGGAVAWRTAKRRRPSRTVRSARSRSWWRCTAVTDPATVLLVDNRRFHDFRNVATQYP
jgi:hypothetical protein